tara:strand:- start:740 stop:1489 length:750 start_codon:yes stop_codon:yes gene_type:complete
MIQTPLVSIITVVYNGAKTLEQTIQSVINQTYQNIEYIIIDGGSTDGTLEIIKKYEKHISYWHSKPDKGLYDAMNIGIGMATGELIGMINSDDWYELNAAELMVTAYQKHPKKTIFHANRYDIDDNDTKTIKKHNPSAFKFKYYGMTYNHPSMFIARSEYKKHLYNIELIALSDYQFVLESYLRDKSIFYYVDKAIVNYRLDGISGQMSVPLKLKEGWKSRSNSKLSLPQNILSFCIRLSVYILYKPKK